jgi:hypothetical protein
MTPTPVYTFDECMDLIKDCRLDELVALSALLIEEWKCYSVNEQMALLTALVNSRKALQSHGDRKFLFLKSRDNKNLEK